MTARLVFALAMLGPLSVAGAQGAILTGTSAAQYVELRPLALDSAAEASTDSVSAVLRRTVAGALSNCAPTDAYCYFYRSASRAGLLAMTQDFDVTAWGLGEGVSADVQIRVRTAVGDGRTLWPQATQAFAVSAVYVDLARPAFDVRAGRQWIASGLGMFNFDGAALDAHVLPQLDVKGYAGRSLIQGLDRPLGEAALAPVEDLPPADDAYLLGAIAQLGSATVGSMRVQYQREMEPGNAALYSERFAADATVYLGGGILTGNLTRDLAAKEFNDLGATFALPIAPRVNARVEVTRYVPFFDLWTIWGAFSPVGYTEGMAVLDWSIPDPRIALSLTGGRRTYDDTQAEFAALPLRSDAWRVGATARYQPGGAFTLEGDYDIDLGFGASTTDGDLVLRWSPTPRASLGVRALGFQNLNEFTVGAGTVVGGGIEGSATLRPDLRVVGDATVYRHVGEDQSQITDWNQRRVSLRLEWSVGADPGVGRAQGKTS